MAPVICDTIVKAGPAPIAHSDPAAQVRRNAGRLHDFLEADDIAQYVKGAVVWANPDSPIEVADSDTPVWRLDRLEEPLAAARSRSMLPTERLARIHAKLERLTLAGPATPAPALPGLRPAQPPILTFDLTGHPAIRGFSRPSRNRIRRIPSEILTFGLSGGAAYRVRLTDPRPDRASRSIPFGFSLRCASGEQLLDLRQVATNLGELRIGRGFLGCAGRRKPDG